MRAHDNIPKSVRIGAHDYRIEIMPDDWKKNDGYVTSFGEFSEYEQRISLRGDVKSKSMANDVCLHEIVHAIVLSLGLSLKDEERIAQVIGAGLTQVFRDNKQLIQWLTEAETNECKCGSVGPCKCGSGPSTDIVGK